MRDGRTAIYTSLQQPISVLVLVQTALSRGQALQAKMIYRKQRSRATIAFDAHDEYHDLKLPSILTCMSNHYQTWQYQTCTVDDMAETGL